MTYDMQKLTDIEMAEQILNVLVLDVDYDDPDNDLPDMIQQFADRIGTRDMHGPLTTIEKHLHIFCPEYHCCDTLAKRYTHKYLKHLTQHIQYWIDDAIDERDAT